MKTSTMMVEYMECFEATLQVVWIGKFIEGMSVLNIVAGPLQILCGITAIVFYSKNMHVKYKHMHVKYKLIRKNQTRVLQNQLH